METMELKCIVCAKPVEVKVCDRDYIKTNPAAEEWDYWIHCSDEECENHIGEGYFQHYPDWVYTETRYTRREHDEINISILNLKVKVEVLLQDRLEKIRNGEIRLKVYDQHDECVIEDALKNFDRFDAQADKWLNEGVNLANVDPMVWAYQLMEHKHGSE